MSLSNTFNETVWKLHGRQKPRRCPCCQTRDTLHYIGFAPNYEPGLQAQLYQCRNCDMWVDCIWPKSLTQILTVTAIARSATHHTGMLWGAAAG